MGDGGSFHRVPRPIVRERTREAALRSLQQVGPTLREALLKMMQSRDPRLALNPPDDAAQIFPTKLALAVIYIPSMVNERHLHVIDPQTDFFYGRR
jgi:hypothetical protein